MISAELPVSPAGNNATVLVWLFVIGAVCWLFSLMGRVSRQTRKGRRGKRPAANRGHPEGAPRRPALITVALHRLEDTLKAAREQSKADRERSNAIKEQTRRVNNPDP